MRKALGDEVPILVKMNANDGTYSGLELPDALIMAEEFAKNGADVLVVTCGNVSQNGMFMLRGPSNVDKLALALPGAMMKTATALAGPFAVPEVGFNALFFLRLRSDRVKSSCIYGRIRKKIDAL